MIVTYDRPVLCKLCGEKRETTEYRAVTLNALRTADRIHDAVCLHCDPVHIPPDYKRKQVICFICKEGLPLDKFSIACQKRKTAIH